MNKAISQLEFGMWMAGLCLALVAVTARLQHEIDGKQNKPSLSMDSGSITSDGVGIAYPETKVADMTDEALLVKWQQAESDRYETGREMNKRGINANWRLPPNVITYEGYVRFQLRGAWYGLYYWRETNSEHSWSE